MIPADFHSSLNNCVRTRKCAAAPPSGRTVARSVAGGNAGGVIPIGAVLGAPSVMRGSAFLTTVISLYTDATPATRPIAATRAVKFACSKC